MEEKMTRKGFLAAAAAAGAAALVPGVAMADEGSDSDAAPLAALDVASVEGAEALEGTEWAQREAGYPIDVVKSHSGMHSMNAPGYFVFTGWDPENDWVGDMGFGYFNDSFFTRARLVDVWTQGISVNGERVADYVVERGTVDMWEYEKWSSGRARCWARRTYEVEASGWSASEMFPGGYAANSDYCPGGRSYPFRFAEPPCETFSAGGALEGGCELFTTALVPNSDVNMGVYQLYRTSLDYAKPLTVSYNVSVEGRLA